MLYRSNPTPISTLQFLLLCQLLSHFHFLYLCIATWLSFVISKLAQLSLVVSMLAPQHMLYPGLDHFHLGTNAWSILIFVSTLQHFYDLYHSLFHFNLCMDAPSTFFRCILTWPIFTVVSMFDPHSFILWILEHFHLLSLLGHLLICCIGCWATFIYCIEHSTTFICCMIRTFFTFLSISANINWIWIIHSSFLKSI